MKRLQKCCCCASTRTGSIITAILGIILSIATIILIWVAPRNMVSFKTFIFDDEVDRDLADKLIPHIILTIALCFTVIMCTLLIVAIQKRRSWLMLPWVVLGFVLAIGLLIAVLHNSITFFIDGDNWTGAMILVFGLLYLCIYVYLWVVVFSHYLDVRDEEERGRYRKAPYRR